MNPKSILILVHVETPLRLSTSPEISQTFGEVCLKLFLKAYSDSWLLAQYQSQERIFLSEIIELEAGMEKLMADILKVRIE